MDTVSFASFIKNLRGARQSGDPAEASAAAPLVRHGASRRGARAPDELHGTARGPLAAIADAVE